MKNLIIFSLVLMGVTCLQAQEGDSTVYKNLEIVKNYAVRTSRFEYGSKVTYTVNGKGVSKAEYEKYDTWDALASCCPCILRDYDEHDVLISEAVACTDCLVGYYKGFYPNGSLKVKGQFKEHASDDWTHIDCHVPDGKWLYYNKRGKVKKIEFWDEGEFVKQIPKSKDVEIWEAELWLNGVEIDTQRVALSDFNKLKIIPQYKNSNRSNQLNIKIDVLEYESLAKREIDFDDFENIDMKGLLKEAGILDVENIEIRIRLFNGDKREWTFLVRLKD